MKRLLASAAAVAGTLSQSCSSQSDVDRRFLERATALASLPASCRNFTVDEHKKLDDTSEVDGESFKLEINADCRNEWLSLLENRSDFVCADDLADEHFQHGRPNLCMADFGDEPGPHISVWVAFRDNSTVELAMVTAR